MATDRSGNVYVADSPNHTIRNIFPAAAATWVVLTWAVAAGVEGHTDGDRTLARCSSPTGLALDAGGNLHVADSVNYTIRLITAAGVVTTFAGAAGLEGTADGTDPTTAQTGRAL